MSSLTEVFTAESKKSAVVDDCLELIDAEVAYKGGLAGLATKAGYGVVKGIKPGFIKQDVSDLLPEFAKAIEPIYEEAKSKSKPVAEYMRDNASRVADALLAITDAKAQRSKSGAVKGTYEKLRGSAKKNVEAAVPRLGKMVEKFAG
jgi:uncharacterized protein YjbJ (UPF0337 family)